MPITVTERIQFSIEFIFDQAQKLFLVVHASWKNEPLNLALSSFLTFLFKHENELDKQDQDFAYKLVKCVRKVKMGDDIIEAIATDYEMGMFFKSIRQHRISLTWRYGNTEQPLEFTDQLPFTLRLSPYGRTLVCELAERKDWCHNPLAWLTFQCESDLYCFSNGKILMNPPSGLVDYLTQFLDHEVLKYDAQAAVQFLNSIYTPYKNKITWLITTEISEYLPKESAPVAVLTVTEAGGILNPVLSYRYQNTDVWPDNAAAMITDVKTGQVLKRQPDMEAIYQQDLMDLFMEYQLPFLLQSPGDIARFLDKLVPALRDREWLVDVQASDYKILDHAATLDFAIRECEGTTRNWFYFEPTCVIGDQKLSLQETVRLMLQNNGYIQTKKGYIRLSDKTQDELKLLAKYDAFGVGKKFSKAEILPLIAVANLTGRDSTSQKFVDQIQNMQRNFQLVPKSGFNGELRDYQQYGVNWLNFLFSCGFGGVLADDMGLGKTVQTLAFTDAVMENGPCLVIGPTNVLFNWQNEIAKFVPHRKAAVYSGANRVKILEDLKSIDYLITSYGVMKNDIDWLSEVPFRAVLVDEAQYIKNPGTLISKAIKQIKADFRLVMTGTPIENHLQDLWNLYDFVMPGYLGTARQFDIEVADQNRDLLRTRIRPFVLRREKKEVLDSLPEKTEIVLKCPLTDEQTALYQEVLKAARQGISNSVGKVDRMNILTTLLKLRQICIHPALIQNAGLQNMPSSKFDLVCETLEELVDEGHKVVLFTQFTGMLDILQHWIREKGYPSYRIDGSLTGKKRQELVQLFQDSETAGIFIISLKAGGVGINLTAADYVIHMDPWWNPAVEAQATDRVHRMGQKNKVIVYKLITEGTIEEKIQALQEEKKQLLGEIVDIDSLDEKAIDFESLKQLLM